MLPRNLTHLSALIAFVFTLEACDLKIDGVAVPTNRPVVSNQTGACGSLQNGAPLSRVRYQADTVPFGESCVSQAQIAQCVDGTLSAFAGDFTFENCVVSPPVVNNPPPVTCQGGYQLSGNTCMATTVVNPPAQAGSCWTISQFGITWTFSKAVACGQYANSDWWVVGPVTLTGPVSVGARNGSMIGPATAGTWANNGFDDRIENFLYDASLNIGAQMPYNVPVNRSVISSISYGALRGRNQLDYQAVLTVVASAPPAGSFRPPMLGIDKVSHWNKSQIDYTKLKKLPVMVGSPTLDFVAEMYERPMLDIASEYPSNYLIAFYNTPIDGKNYGRELSLGSSYAGLVLNFNYTDAQKELLAIRFIQHGIDVYGAVKVGLTPYANAGHQNGKKLPMLMAGVLLNDNNIIAAADGSKNIFSEDGQHFYVTQNDINTPRYVSTVQPADPYPQSALGMPEWGPSGENNTAGYNWGRTYRAVCGPNLVGTALTVKIMGLESQWNDPAFLDYYTDRFVPTEHNNGTINAFMLAMWDLYAK